MKLQTPFVRLPVERTKVVTIGASLNRYGFEMFFEMFFSLIFLKLRRGLNVLRSWKSTGSSSTSAKHKVTPKSFWLSSADADFALCRALEGWGCLCGWSELSVGSLFNDLDLENSLGGEREGESGEENFMLRRVLGGLKRCLLGVFLLTFFRWDGWGVGFCRGDCAGGYCSVSFGDDWWVFFSVGVLSWVQSLFF